MRILILSIFVAQVSFASPTVPLEWVSPEAVKSSGRPSAEFDKYYDAILDSQEKALEQMQRSEKGLFGFSMNEMITDISVTRSGIFGLSAYKARKAVEIRWIRKKTAQAGGPEADDAQLVIPAQATSEDLSQVADTISAIAKQSGKVKNLSNLRKNLLATLNQTDQTLKGISATHLGRWALDGLRLDLNLSASGQVWAFASVGARLRVRIDWKLKRRVVTDSKAVTSNAQSRFVTRALADLDKALEKSIIPGYRIKRINIGVGLSRKSGFFGLWKSSQGFIGYLRFVPAPKARAVAAIGEEDGYEMEDGTAATSEKGLLSRFFLRRADFRSGLQKGVEMTSFFADKNADRGSRGWYVDEFMTITDVSRSGFFGLADVSSNGVVEFEMKRK